VPSVRRCWKLPLCLTESMSAGSKTDLLLAKADPIREGASASGITFKEGEKTCRGIVEGEYVGETTLQTLRSMQKE